jgi:hypothetical protein
MQCLRANVGGVKAFSSTLPHALEEEPFRSGSGLLCQP